jgi:hypothetical protein
MAIRITAARPGSVVFYVPAAAVDHSVPAERLTVRYFLRRCWHEGRSKAYVVRLAGADAGLSAERRQAAAVIPATLLADLRASISGDGLAFARVAAAAAGLAATAAGYLAGRALTLPPGARHQLTNAIGNGANQTRNNGQAASRKYSDFMAR